MMMMMSGWLWAVAWAGGGDGEAWVEELTARGIDPMVAVDCRPVGETLARLPGLVAQFGPPADGPKVNPAFVERLQTAEGRASLGFDEGGVFRVAMGNDGGGRQFALEVGFAGDTDAVDAMLALLFGQPRGQSRWERGRLVMLNGRPTGSEFGASLRDGVLRLSTDQGPGVPQEDFARLLRSEEAPQDACVVTVDTAAMGDLGDGHAVATVPLAGNGAIEARLYLASAPPMPAITRWDAPPDVRTRARPVMVLSVGAPELITAVAALMPDNEDLPTFEDVASLTMAMFEDDGVAVILVPVADTRSSGAKRTIQALLGPDVQVEKAGRNLFEAEGLWASVDDLGVVLASDTKVLRDVRKQRGDRWLNDGEMALGGAYPVVVRVGPGIPELPVSVTLAVRGAPGHLVAALYSDDFGALFRAFEQMGEEEEEEP